MILFEVYHSMVILKQFPRMVFKKPPTNTGGLRGAVAPYLGKNPFKIVGSFPKWNFLKSSKMDISRMFFQ